MILRPSSLKKRLYLGVASYFRWWANFSFRRWNPRVIAVTGSVGKTTMLHLLEQQLGKQAHYSHNANSSFGIAFDIVGLRGVTGSKLRWLYLFIAVPLRSLFYAHSQKFYVVEIDGERPRETEFLATWLKPEVTLWVSVGHSHAVHFDTQVASGQFKTVEDAIAHEFATLPKNTRKLVIYDGDDRQMTRALTEIKGPEKQSVSHADLTKYEVYPEKTTFILGNDTFNFPQPLPPEVATQLSMLRKLAEYLELPPQTDMSKFIQPPGRSNFFKGKKGVKLVDSSYNAHLISMQSIIELFQAMQTEHKWIVIGDMVEQGKSEQKQHERLGELLAAAKFERYILVGRRTQEFTLPRLDPARTVSFLHPGDAAAYLDGELTGQETVLFKGSQYLEGIIEHLLADPKDSALLPRREKAAEKRRKLWSLSA